MKKNSIALAALAAGLLACNAFAATYYVSPTGNDSNAGTSDAPVATIKKGVALASAAGDIVSIADGDYEIGAKITVSKAITIQGNVTDCSKVVVNCKGTQMALYNDSAAGWEVAGLTFTNINRAIQTSRGITVRHCVFREASTAVTANGGAAIAFAALASGNVAVIEDCLFEDISPSGTYNRGAVYIASGVPLTLRRCVFRNCTTSGNGGAIGQMSDGGASVTAEDCQFLNCRAVAGGALFIPANSGKTNTFRNCLFAGNVSSSKDAGGSAVYVKSTTVFENCTFADNACPNGTSGSAAAIRNNAADCSLVNCVFWNNTRSGDAEKTIYSDSSTMVATATKSAAPADSMFAAGTDNVSLSASPFVAPGVYTLVEKIGGVDNPCIDGGSTLDWMTGAKDLAGNDRINNSVPDMGAYEYYAVTKKLGSLMYIDLQ